MCYRVPFLSFFATNEAKSVRKRPFELWRGKYKLSERADEALIQINKIKQWKSCQAYFESQNSGILLNSHEVAVLEYVGEDEDFKEQGTTYAA